MQGKLGASVPGQAVPEELGQFPYFVDDVLLDVSGVVPVRQVQQDREPGGAFHERAYGALVPGAGDQVTLPMARYRPVLDLLEALRDLGHGNRDLRSPSPRVYVIK